MKNQSVLWYNTNEHYQMCKIDNNLDIDFLSHIGIDILTNNVIFSEVVASAIGDYLFSDIGRLHTPMSKIGGDKVYTERCVGYIGHE